MKIDRPVSRVVFAAGCAAAALAVRLLLDPILASRIPYATFYVAVAVSAVWAGPLAGAVALVLGGLGGSYFVVPPRHVIWIEGSDHQLGFALYVVVSVALILLAERQWSANRRLATEARRREVAERRSPAVGVPAEAVHRFRSGGESPGGRGRCLSDCLHSHRRGQRVFGVARPVWCNHVSAAGSEPASGRDAR